jgi:cysteinyl-tRNA synthetase
LPPPLRLFNTLSGRKEPFVPLEPGRVKMFVCGPTVQSLVHLGHARTYVFFDTVARYLAHLGYRVNCLINITDVDERITQAASASNEDPEALARRFSKDFVRDMATLRCTTVSRFEPVSAHVDIMIEQVAALVRSGMAYVADGWVYFDTSKFGPFGRLSHQSRRELSLRPLELSPKKKHLSDFALWRPEVLLEGKWKSPWGLGSPGWHIQDTAVTVSLLGSQYDIHGGAYELVYPHHEAEIAQAESLTGVRPFVKYWVHTHHLNMEGRKMSKSAGNVVTVREALAHYSPDELRLFLLGKCYRDDMGLRGMDEAASRLRRMRRTAASIVRGRDVDGASPDPEVLSRFEVAMSDDFDIPLAIASVERALKRAATGREGRARADTLAAAVTAMEMLGVNLLGAS